GGDFRGRRQGQLPDLRGLRRYVRNRGRVLDEGRRRQPPDLVGQNPLDLPRLETDSPDLPPRDLRPQPRARRNEPAFLPHIAQTVARAVGRPVAEVAAETSRNARTLFAIDEPGPSSAAKRPPAV